MIMPDNLKIGHKVTWVGSQRAKIVSVDRARGWYKIRHFTDTDRAFPTGPHGHLKAGIFYPEAWVFVDEEST